MYTMRLKNTSKAGISQSELKALQEKHFQTYFCSPFKQHVTDKCSMKMYRAILQNNPKINANVLSKVVGVIVW